jgi:hypothetical protein
MSPPRSVAPVEYQRQANAWLLDWRKLARARGVLPVAIAGAPVDVLDALRSEMNMRNGAALSGADTGAATSWREVGYQVKRELHHLAALPAALPTIGSGRRVLMVPRLPGHLADLEPVAEALAERHGAAVVMAAPTVELSTRITKWPAVDFYAAGGAARRLVALDAAKLSVSLWRVATDVDIAHARTALLRSARRVLWAQLPDALRSAHAAWALLDASRPELVVVGNPYTLEGRTTAILAQARGVPVAAIEHGSIFPNDPIWDECPVDLVCCWGEVSRAALVSCGVDPKRITITGAPRLDAIANRRPEGARSSRVLIATSGPGDQVSASAYASFVAAVAEAAARAPDLDWVVKPHRKEPPDAWREAARAHGATIRVLDVDRLRFGADIWEHLTQAGVLVTMYSTTALDAMVAGVPVISFLPGGAAEIPGIEFLAHCHRERDPQGLVGRVRDLAAGNDAKAESARQYVGRHYHNFGTAARAVADRLLALVEHRHAA